MMLSARLFSPHPGFAYYVCALPTSIYSCVQGRPLQAGVEEGVHYPTVVLVKHQLEALVLQVKSILLSLEGLSSNQRQAWAAYCP